MQINLITGVDGSGKSTVFEKLKQLNFPGTALLLVPRIDEESISNQKIYEVACSINELGDAAARQKSTSYKALNLFASMMVFSDICEEKKAKCQVMFCERHPLIDSQIYSLFYAPKLRPDLLLEKEIKFLDENFSAILDFIIAKIPGEFLSIQASKSKTVFAFIHDYFAVGKSTAADFFERLFRVDFPDRIYFLEGDATVFYNRLANRAELEPHEEINFLQTLTSSYSKLLNSLSGVQVERINANDFSALDMFYLKLVNQLACSLSQNPEFYPSVPGRGLVTEQSTEMRQDFLENINCSINHIKKTSLSVTDVKNKIESFVGTVEIPLGIVGPLLFNEEAEQEVVYTLGGTLEGALIASMNRGAKAITLSGGFNAHFVHQKMVRSPMFQFENLKEAVLFEQWVKGKFPTIKQVCESHSNHAKLIEIKPLIISRSVHLNFIFETGDASGQNMTTTCTWHAMLLIVDSFESEMGIKIKDYVIEGNCSSDKKASSYSVQNGRGVHVIAECHLEESIIQSVLRTSSEAIFNNYLPSVSATRFYGMPSYNINVANAIAAIFAATGQDLACVHESSNAFLTLEKTGTGLYFSLTLPSLVVATIGGGTNLPRQQEALAIMKCDGKDKLQRFAKLIAGFALGLEISTYSAIVSGAFAKAHEQLGRNKPINWITRAEISKEFIKSMVNETINADDISLVVLEEKSIDNGIITTLSGIINNKPIGFFTALIDFLSENKTLKAVLKSKAIDSDVIKGLHKMAALINPELSDLIYKYRYFLEYNNCHIKEIQLYKALTKMNLDCIPKFYGSYENEQRETFLILQEFLDKEEMILMDSENHPHLWSPKLIKKAIAEISNCHRKLEVKNDTLDIVPVFDLNAAKPLYHKLLSIVSSENPELMSQGQLDKLLDFNDNALKYQEIENLPIVVIHNDFNPRNVAVRNNEDVCIYDWELAVKNIPHRDIVEFLAFTLPDSFTELELEDYLKFHYHAFQSKVEWEAWKKGYVFAAKEFILTRANFYCTANIVLKLKFHKRIIVNALRMLDCLEN